jgi:hypothetical protein
MEGVVRGPYLLQGDGDEQIYSFKISQALLICPYGKSWALGIEGIGSGLFCYATEKEVELLE